VRIHASRDVIRSLIKSCSEALRLVPGLVACTVLETAPDQSWQIIRHVLDYSWYVPKLTYEIRATYDDPTRVSIERISGDLSVLKGSWYLQSDGDYTIAHYAVPKMLRALRARAESVQQQGPAHPGSKSGS
jgi:hypothetical protein